MLKKLSVSLKLNAPIPYPGRALRSIYWSALLPLYFRSRTVTLSQCVWVCVCFYLGLMAD